MPSFFRVSLAFILSLILLAPATAATAPGTACQANGDARFVPTTIQAPTLVPAIYRPGEGTSVTTVAYRRTVVRYHHRSKRHRVAIIGGSTVGGAVVGALVGGKKGAIAGGLVGGTAGAIYDHKTHRRLVRVRS